MSYAGTVDEYRVYACDMCGARQVDTADFREREEVAVGIRTFVVDLCGDHDYETAQAWLVDRLGLQKSRVVVPDEVCRSCGAPSCDCPREWERGRWAIGGGQ